MGVDFSIFAEEAAGLGLEAGFFLEVDETLFFLVVPEVALVTVWTLEWAEDEALSLKRPTRLFSRSD